MATRAEILAALPADCSGKAEDAVRHGIKERFKARLLDAMLPSGAKAAGVTEEQSIAAMRGLLGPLDAADRGTLSEQWYERFRRELKGETDIHRHPQLTGPGIEGVKSPDFVEGAAIVEVKSTQKGLSGEDVARLETYLGAAKNKGRGNQLKVTKRTKGTDAATGKAVKL